MTTCVVTVTIDMLGTRREKLNDRSSNLLIFEWVKCVCLKLSGPSSTVYKLLPINK